MPVIPNSVRLLMKTIPILVASLIALSAGAAFANDYKVGTLEIDNPWSRAVPKGGTVAAGYMTIKNNGTTADRLTGASTSVAGKVEVHEMSMDNGVMKMRPVEGGIEIKPGETVTLKPGSDHLMLMNIKHALEAGKTVEATLQFEKAGTVKVEFAILAMGAAAPGAPAGGGSMMMEGHGGHMMQMQPGQK
jgi:periplasmic copper chaperone A